MATAQSIISAATIDPALLAALKAAVPEQLGDDLVLRLPDGRVFYIDGFFAADETGDGLAPVPGALALARDVADLLLGADDIATAAGSPDPAVPPGGGTGFQPFPSDAPSISEAVGIGEPERRRPDSEDADRDSDARESARSKLTYPEEFGGQAFAPLNLSGIGVISLAAGSAASPTWGGYFSVRDLFALENSADTRADGWFAGLTKAFPHPAAFQIDTFATRFDRTSNLPSDDLISAYARYLDAHDDLATFVGDRSLWANLTPLDGVRDNSVLSPGATTGQTPESIFGGDDVIFGGTLGIDRLSGFAGDDILVGFGGENSLYGGAGDDLLVAIQGSSPLVIDGGDGTDTFLLVINQAYQILAKDIGAISHIERLLISPEDPHNPNFLNEDNGSGRITAGGLPFVFDIDAQTILDWGGSLIIDSDTAAIRLADVDNWTRLPTDPSDPTHVHYVTDLAGQTITLSVLASADQPIADIVLGTSKSEEFFLGDRRFGILDGGAGDDQILGGLSGSPIGLLDLSDPGSVPFRNIENFVLNAASDQLTLSAAAIDAMTDTRNTLWVTSSTMGSAAAVGAVALSDPAAWTALGYYSAKTDEHFSETRVGEIYGSTVNGQNIYLFVQLGMTQPIVGATTNIDHWVIGHAGWVDLPPTGTLSDLAIIDLANAGSNLLMLNVGAVAELAGADHSVSIIGDGSVDAVEFSDTTQWSFSHIDGGFTIYHGEDGVGSPVELRIASNLAQPYLLPDPTGADLDHLDLTNGHYNLLTLSAESAFDLAGPDHRLAIYGDGGDAVALSDPENWHLIGKDGSNFVYEADDGAGHILQLQLGAEIGRPLLQPTGTNGDDILYAVDVQFSDVIDGKDGFDTLIVLDSGQLLLTNEFARNLEVVDLHNGFNNSFGINAVTLVTNNINGPMYVMGDAGDIVTFGDPARWTDTGQTTSNPALSGYDFHLYQAVYHATGGDVTVQLALDVTLAQPVLV